uniref:Uncharacterized protein n=1 Tax=Anopheles atroparvus TaxID=41427 RepID=A0AAG5DWB5_ANOAO
MGKFARSYEENEFLPAMDGDARERKMIPYCLPAAIVTNRRRDGAGGELDSLPYVDLFFFTLSNWGFSKRASSSLWGKGCLLLFICIFSIWIH